MLFCILIIFYGRIPIIFHIAHTVSSRHQSIGGFLYAGSIQFSVGVEKEVCAGFVGRTEEHFLNQVVHRIRISVRGSKCGKKCNNWNVRPPARHRRSNAGHYSGRQSDRQSVGQYGRQADTERRREGTDRPRGKASGGFPDRQMGRHDHQRTAESHAKQRLKRAGSMAA